MHKFHGTVVLLLILILSSLIFAADSFTGKWKGTSKDGENSIDFVLNLKQDGDDITGTIDLNYNTVEVSGTCKDNQLEFTIDAGDTKYTATATVKDNKLEGKWKNDRGGEGIWSAEKEAETK